MPSPHTDQGQKLVDGLRTAGNEARKLQQKLLQAEMLLAMAHAPTPGYAGLPATTLAHCVLLYTRQLKEAEQSLEASASDCLRLLWGITPGKPYLFISNEGKQLRLTVHSARATPFKDCLDLVVLGTTENGTAEHFYLASDCQILPQVPDNVLDFTFYKAKYDRQR